MVLSENASPGFCFASLHNTPTPPSTSSADIENGSHAFITTGTGNIAQPDIAQTHDVNRAGSDKERHSNPGQDFYDTSQEDSGRGSDVRVDSAKVSRESIRSLQNSQNRRSTHNQVEFQVSTPLVTNRALETNRPFKPPDIGLKTNSESKFIGEGNKKIEKENKNPEEVERLGDHSGARNSLSIAQSKADLSRRRSNVGLGKKASGLQTGQSHNDEPQAPKILSKNAAAGKHKQIQLAKQAEAKTAKLDGWETDSDMESVWCS